MLDEIGVSPGAQALYRFALERAVWTPDELAMEALERAGLSPHSARAALQELVTLKMLRPSGPVPVQQLRVVPPAVALGPRLVEARDRSLRLQQVLDRVALAVSELDDLHTRARTAQNEHSIERLCGVDAVRTRLEELALGAGQEALSFLPGGAQGKESLEASRPLDEAAMRRGISLRSVFLHSAANDPATSAYLRWLVDSGGETRTVATLPLRMLIVDRSVAVVPIDAQRSGAGALVVSSGGLLTALLALFESVWLTGREVGAGRTARGADLSDTEREVLRILASGATDEGVARQLGVSVRTVRRLTALLMDRFDARSRFELGLRLGSAGWSPGTAPTRDGRLTGRST